MRGPTDVGLGRNGLSAQPIGPVFLPQSPWPEDEPSAIERLLESLDNHVVAEAESLTTYLTLAGSLEDPVAQILLQLLTDDEERHHTLLRRMAETLRDSLYWTYSSEALPVGSASDKSRTAANVATIKGLVAQEHDGSEHFRRLARDAGTLSNGLFALLLEMMASDSERHERILRFLQRRFEDTPGAR